MLSRLLGRISGPFLAVSLTLLPVRALRAQTAAPEPTGTASNSTFDLDTKELVLRGNARLNSAVGLSYFTLAVSKIARAEETNLS